MTHEADPRALEPGEALISPAAIDEIMRRRLEIAAIDIAICHECGEIISAIDPLCQQFVREPDGECVTYWYHARCVGCDFESEITRQAGCSACARECAPVSRDTCLTR